MAIMIYQHDGKFIFECDACSNRFEHVEDEGGLTGLGLPPGGKAGAPGRLAGTTSESTTMTLPRVKGSR
jgi:hypothetical protein